MTLPVAGVIGWPIGHSKSPVIHRFWLAQLGLDGEYGRFPVAPEDLGAAIRGLRALGLRGVNVTVPHKIAVMEFLDRIGPRGRAVGAVNTVVVEDGALVGRNTDVAGFLEPLRGVFSGGGDGPAIGHAVVLGAGGAARAVLVGLKTLGVGRVTVLNRTVAKGARLLDELGLAGDARPLDAVPDADLVVNATSLGMRGMPPLPVAFDGLRPGACVYDIVYAPLETALLAAARAKGCRVIDGLRMLVGQAAPAFAAFYGVAPPRDDDDALRRLLLAGA